MLLHIFSNVNCFKIVAILLKVKIVFLFVKNAVNHLFVNYFQ